MFEFSVSNDMKKGYKEGSSREGSSTLCLTLIIKELIISVEHSRVVTTLNIIKHQISYLV